MEYAFLTFVFCCFCCMGVVVTAALSGAVGYLWYRFERNEVTEVGWNVIPAPPFISPPPTPVVVPPQMYQDSSKPMPYVAHHHPSLNEETTNETDLDYIPNWAFIDERPVSYYKTLKDNMVSSFNDADLQVICFELDIDYDHFMYDSKENKMQALIQHLHRQQRIGELVALCVDKRPNINWDESLESGDVFTLTSVITPLESEKKEYLKRLLLNKLIDKGYPNESIRAFATCFMELTQNALEHGCDNNGDCVAISVICNDVYIALTITNPPGIKLDLQRAIEERLDNYMHSHRGRGLIMAHRSADKLMSIMGGRGVKAVIYSSFVELFIGYDEKDGCGIIGVKSGITNPSIGRRIESVIDDMRFSRILVDMVTYREHVWYEFDEDISVIITHVCDIKGSTNKKIAFVMSPYVKGWIHADYIFKSSEAARNWLLCDT